MSLLAVAPGSWLPAWLAAVLGCCIVLGTASSVIRTLVVTRGLNSIIARTIQAIPSGILRFIARRFRSYRTRDSILSWQASLSIVSMLTGWLVLFLIGYSLILFGTSNLAFYDAVREAGSSLFTLGFASSTRAQLTLVDFVAAVTGPIVIGLLIGYLPTLYAAYNRRELDVSLLKARAGEPSWGPEILARSAQFGTDENRHKLWREWEKWAADVSESHSTYPVLIYTRSARPYRNWLIGLLAVMDSAAMSLALNPNDGQVVRRTLLRQGVECLHDLARVARIDYVREPSPHAEIQLTFEEFADAIALLDRSGYEHIRSTEEAWPFFKQWRATYEHIAYELALQIDAVPAKWSGPRNPATPVIAPREPIYIVNNPDGSLRVTGSDDPGSDDESSADE